MSAFRKTTTRKLRLVDFQRARAKTAAANTHANSNQDVRWFTIIAPSRCMLWYCDAPVTNTEPTNTKKTVIPAVVKLRSVVFDELLIRMGMIPVDKCALDYLR